MAGKSVISLDVFIVILLITCDKFANAINDCQTHPFSKSINSTKMQFTKEAVSREYALNGQFKSLQCCAKGYRSLEWFKNGQPYPWSSSLILYPQAENQTIYTRHATFNDNGNYTCVIRNDTHKMEHVIEFTVQASLPDSPLATYKPHDQYIERGSEARLYCEAFVGSIRLPDSKSFISWFRVFDDGLEQNIDSQEVIRREDDQIVGALLTISAVELHDYGRYLCRIDNGNAAHRLEMSAWLIGSTPIHAQDESLMSALVLAISAVILVILLMLAIKYISMHVTSHHRRDKKLCHSMNSSESIRIREVI